MMDQAARPVFGLMGAALPCCRMGDRPWGSESGRKGLRQRSISVSVTANR